MVRVVVTLAAFIASACLQDKAVASVRTVKFQALDDEGLQVRNTLAHVGARQNAGEYGYESVECELGDWQNTTDCDPLTLTQKFVRPVKTAPSGDGAACAEVTEVRKCQPVHCHVGEWSEWSDCLEDGYKERTREILQEPLYGGRACPHYLDRVKCRPEDCLVCEWSPWKCDFSTGNKTRTRIVVRKPQLTGKPCPELEEVDKCDPIDCELSDEYDDEWTECDENGDRHKYRKIKIHERFGGKPCPPPETVWKTDKGACPPQNCELGDADPTSFGQCTEDPARSNKWFKTGKRTVKQEAQYGGEACPDDSVEEECPPVPCELGDYEFVAEDTCDVEGKRLQRQVVKTPAEYGGSCDPDERRETDVESCPPQNCELGDADPTSFGQCTEDPARSNKWFKTGKRTVKQEAQYGGEACPDDSVEEECPPVPCELGDYEFVAEDTCDVEGKRLQRQVVKTPAEYGGSCDPDERRETDVESCPPKDCELDGEDTATYGECAEDASRGGKWFKKGKRGIKQAPQYGGKACPDGVVEQECKPVNCKCGAWGPWSSCNYGNKQRAKVIVEPAKFGGMCNPEVQIMPC